MTERILPNVIAKQNLPTMGMKSTVTTSMQDILSIWIGCENENFLFLKEIETYKKSRTITKTKKMQM